MIASFFAVSSVSGVNLPMLVAGVFAATFLVVCALAYVFLGRSQSRTDGTTNRMPPVLEPRPADMPVFDSSAATVVDAPAPMAVSIETISRTPRAAPAVAPTADSYLSDGSSAKPIDPGKATLLTLYRLLMFLTGGTGLVATYLMFSAVEGFSRVLVIAIVVLGLSVAALYRGLVPDPELTGKK
jgi:hypothetical protein